MHMFIRPEFLFVSNCNIRSNIILNTFIVIWTIV